MRLHHIAAWLCVLAAGITTPRVTHAQANPAVADSSSSESTILRIDPNSDLVIDMPHGASGMVGDEYSLFRPIIVHHPVTGRALRDRFRIGAVRITEPGNSLSLARAIGRLAREPAVGDILVPVLRIVPDAPTPPPPRPAPTSPHASVQQSSPALPTLSPAAPAPIAVSAPGLSSDERAAIGAWMATMQRPPEVRVALYRGFLRDHPNSAFANDVRHEIDALLALDQALRSVQSAPPAARVENEVAADADIATTLRTGDPFVVAMQIGEHSDVRAAILHVRGNDADAYTSIPFVLHDGGFLRATVGDEFVEPPGLQYFVEVVPPSGHALALIGTSAAPIHVVITDVGTPPERVTGRTRIDLRAEAADVGSGSTPEYFVRVEGDFLQRVELGPLYGYRVGFGLYTGEGQPLCAYSHSCTYPFPSATPAPSLSSTIYGYNELEFAASEFVHFMARFEVGVTGSFGDINPYAGGGTPSGLAFGVGASMRVGRERGTNIVFGGHFFNGIGERAFFEFMFYPQPRVSMMTEAEIFNQVVDGNDAMFRVVEEVGYRIAPSVRLSVRGSYQLRNTDHSGFGGGLAAMFDW